MIKFIATLTSNPSPLEEFVFDSPKIVELSFDYFPSPDELLTKLEPVVFDLKDNKKISVYIEIAKEDGYVVFTGTSLADGRLHGTAMS